MTTSAFSSAPSTGSLPLPTSQPATQHVSNGEYTLTWYVELGAMLMDLCGVVRQFFEAIVSGKVLHGASANSASNVALTGVGAPALLISAGVIGICISIPILKESGEELAKAIKEEQAAVNFLHESFSHTPQGFTGVYKQLDISPKVQETLKEGHRAVELANLSLAINSLMLTMSSAQIAMGVTTLLATKHVLTGLAGFTGVVGATAALNTVYVGRGLVMLTKTHKMFKIVSDFQKELGINEFDKETFKGTLDEKIDILKLADKKSEGYLARRIDQSCLIVGNKQYTPTGVKTWNSERKKFENKQSYTEEEKFTYLECVRKGIFSMKMKTVVSGIIGFAMVLGGLTGLAIGIALCYFTGGLAVPVLLIAITKLSLASSIFFIVMEAVYLKYDSSWAFKTARDILYTLIYNPTPLVVTDPAYT